MTEKTKTNVDTLFSVGQFCWRLNYIIKTSYAYYTYCGSKCTTYRPNRTNLQKNTCLHKWHAYYCTGSGFRSKHKSTLPARKYRYVLIYTLLLIPSEHLPSSRILGELQLNCPTNTAVLLMFLFADQFTSWCVCIEFWIDHRVNLHMIKMLHFNFICTCTVFIMLKYQSAL